MNKEDIRAGLFMIGLNRFNTHNGEERFYINDWLERLVRVFYKTELTTKGTKRNVTSAMIGSNELNEDQIRSINEVKKTLRFWVHIGEYDYTICVKGLSLYTLDLINKIIYPRKFNNVRSLYMSVSILMSEEIDDAI